MRSRIAAVLRRLAQRLDPQVVAITFDRPAYAVRAGLMVTSTTYSHNERSLAVEFDEGVGSEGLAGLAEALRRATAAMESRAEDQRRQSKVMGDALADALGAQRRAGTL